MSEPIAGLVGAAYAGLTAALEGLEPEGWQRTTRTAWTVRELCFHLLLDAQRALVALAHTTERAADVDAVTYWAPFRPGVGAGDHGQDAAPARHARFVRRAAAAYDGTDRLLAQWRASAGAVGRAVLAADAATRVETQRHVLSVADLCSTLVVEATVHHLDLVVDLDAAGPTPAGLAETRRVLEGVHGGPLPASWDDATAALRGTGRLPLDDADRAALGDSAARFPLLG